MKQTKKVLSLLMATALCLSFAAGCTPPDTPNPNPDEGSTTDNNMLRENDFLNDGIDRRFDFDDYDIGKDSGFEEDTGELTDHYYEAENMLMIGDSNNTSHQCIAKSFHFNEAFRGGLALKNYTGNQLVLTIECDKDVRVPVQVHASNWQVNDLAGQPVSSALSITNEANGRRHGVKLNDFIIPSGGTMVSGNQFFTMVVMEFKMDLYKGTNRITIFPGVNMDYFNIRTSATLGENQTPSAWFEEPGVKCSVVREPTEADTGTIRFACGTDGNAEFEIPALTSKIYDKVTDDGAEKYYLTLAGKKVLCSPAEPAGPTPSPGPGGDDGDDYVRPQTMEDLSFSGSELMRYTYGGICKDGTLDTSHWSIDSGVMINGKHGAKFTFGDLKNVTVQSGGELNGAFMRAKVLYTRDNTGAVRHSYWFDATFVNYSDKALEFEFFLRYGSADSANDGYQTVSLDPAGGDHAQRTVSFVWTDKKTEGDTGFLIYFRAFKVGGEAIDSADALERLEGVSFGAQMSVGKDPSKGSEAPGEVAMQKLNFGDSGFWGYDSGGLYETGTGAYSHWGKTGTGTINGEDATEFTFKTYNPMTVTAVPEPSFFRIKTGYDRNNVGVHHTYRLTFTFENTFDKALEFEIFMRYGGADPARDGYHKVTLGAKGSAGAIATVTFDWTDMKDGTDDGFLTFFRAFKVNGAEINTKESLDLLNGASFLVMMQAGVVA